MRLTDREGLTAAAPIALASSVNLAARIRLELLKGPVMGGATELADRLRAKKANVVDAIRVMRSRGEIRGVRPIVLDDIEQRDQRIIHEIEQDGSLATAKQLARAAQVDLADVERLEAAKRIALTGGGAAGRSYMLLSR